MRSIPHVSPLNGKSILFIGGGSHTNCSHYLYLHGLGAHIFICDVPDSSWAAGIKKAKLAGFIPFNLLAFSDLKSRLVTTIASTPDVPTRFDAVVSVDENHLLVANRIAEALGLSFQPFSAVLAAQDKAITRAKLEEAGIPSPACRSIRTEAEAHAALHELGGKLIMKPADGSHSVGIRLIDSPQAVTRAFHEHAQKMHSNTEQKQHKLSTIIIEQFLEGPEVDVDIVMQDDNVVYCAILDNWPIGPPWFDETAAELPSTMPKTLQSRVKEYAADCVRALGFRNGLFHSEVKCTPNGPRLVEINPRLRCGPCSDLHLAANNRNLLEQLCLIATGIPCEIKQEPTSPVSNKPNKHAIGIALNAPCTGIVTSDGWIDRAVKPLAEANVDIINAIELTKKGQHVFGSREAAPHWLGMIVFAAKDRSECRKIVAKLNNLLEVPIDADNGECIRSFDIKAPESLWNTGIQ